MITSYSFTVLGRSPRWVTDLRTDFHFHHFIGTEPKRSAPISELGEESSAWSLLSFQISVPPACDHWRAGGTMDLYLPQTRFGWEHIDTLRSLCT